ncbi:MAG: Hpt domain-containing protein [Pseudomonadota bacterium]
MSMALKKDVMATCRSEGTEKPVDLVHLSSITMGDEALEKELLALFGAQIPKYLQLARECDGPDEVKRISHTIKGSARNIGAFRLAELVKGFEEAGAFDMDTLERELTVVAKYAAGLR